MADKGVEKENWGQVCRWRSEVKARPVAQVLFWTVRRWMCLWAEYSVARYPTGNSNCNSIGLWVGAGL